jgi:hypothetical protein
MEVHGLFAEGREGLENGLDLYFTFGVKGEEHETYEAQRFR